MGYRLREMIMEDLEGVFSRMKEDFPANERAPFSSIRGNIKRKKFLGYILTDGKQDMAYCINTSSTDGKYELIVYLATYEEFRGRGLGTIFLSLIQELYSEKKALILEVELPHDDKSAERIEFYENAGFCLLPKIEYTLFGVSMKLMYYSNTVTLEKMSEDITEIIKDIYSQTLPFFLRGQVKINKMDKIE